MKFTARAQTDAKMTSKPVILNRQKIKIPDLTAVWILLAITGLLLLLEIQTGKGCWCWMIFVLYASWLGRSHTSGSNKNSLVVLANHSRHLLLCSANCSSMKGQPYERIVWSRARMISLIGSFLLLVSVLAILSYFTVGMDAVVSRHNNKLANLLLPLATIVAIPPETRAKKI